MHLTRRAAATASGRSHDGTKPAARIAAIAPSVGQARRVEVSSEHRPLVRGIIVLVRLVEVARNQRCDWSRPAGGRVIRECVVSAPVARTVDGAARPPPLAAVWSEATRRQVDAVDEQRVATAC